MIGAFAVLTRLLAPRSTVISADFPAFRQNSIGTEIDRLRQWKWRRSSFDFKRGDVLLFGREDTGLPDTVREACDTILTIPMPGSADAAGRGGVRSLNLSVACALVTYVAGQQLRLW